MKQSLTDLEVSAVKCPSVERPGFDPKAGSHFVIIPVAELNKAVMNALQYAKLIHGQSVAVHILFSSKDENEIEKRWELNNLDIPLAVSCTRQRALF